MIITKFVSVKYDAIYYQKVEDQKGFSYNKLLVHSAFECTCEQKSAFVLLRSKHDENYGTSC